MNTLHKRSLADTTERPRSASILARPRREQPDAVVNSPRPLPEHMTERTWENTYDLSDDQLAQLEEAETLMERMDLSGAEEILLAMLVSAKDCVPVLSNLCLLYTSPSPRDSCASRMPSSA